MATVLVVAAHPDDELLGCAGTLARHVIAGDAVHIAILAEGSTSRNDHRDIAEASDELQALRLAAQKAGEILGVQSVTCQGLPDNRMDSVDLLDIVKIVEALISEHEPQIVYTHHVGDVNIDHELTHRAVFTACRPTVGHSVERLLAFETVSSTEWTPPGSRPAFVPNWFVDISTTLKRKLEALRAYTTEMRDWPHPRSTRAVETLARWRGATVGVEAAEAFVLMRHVDRLSQA